LQCGLRTHRTVAVTIRDPLLLVELGLVIKSVSVTAKVDIVEVGTTDADPIWLTTAGSSYGAQRVSAAVIASGKSAFYGRCQFCECEDGERTYRARCTEAVDQRSDEVCAAADTRGIENLALEKVSRCASTRVVLY
jgi:hypothetical protein